MRKQRKRVSVHQQTDRTAKSAIRWTATGTIAGWVSVGLVLLGLAISNHWLWFAVPNSIEIQPPSGDIPRCATITGTATLPPGYTVWLAQNGAGEKSIYNLYQATFGGTHSSWSATMTVGPASATGKAFTIYAFALDSQTSQVISSMETSPSKSFFYLTGVPQDVIWDSQLVTRNTQDTQPCP
jgi:hypothetical protein